MAADREMVFIDKLVTGGVGLGRLADGMVVMVEGVLAGERVAVRLGARRGGYRQAELVEVLEPSPERVAPPCPHYGRCGGCDLQHGVAHGQASIKAAILQELLLRSSLFDEEGLAAVWQEPLPSPHPFHYRQRIRLQVTPAGGFGFRRSRSHEVEEVRGCLLARPEINEAMARLAGSLPLARLLRQSRELELIASPADRDLVLLLHFNRRPRPADCKAAAETAAAVGVRCLLLAVEGQGLFGPFGSEGKEALIRFLLPGRPGAGGELVLTVEPGGFSQVNPEQNVNLIRQMLAWAQEEPVGRVLDCHCGMGNFSLPLALAAEQVVGCDLQGAAIRSGRRNAQLNKITNCRFEKQAAASFVAGLAEAGETFDLLLLDPPRQGCADLVPLLPALAAERIIYISCDPATLVRDLAGLAGQGYRVRHLRMVDMFPQTHHLEVITLLDRR
ncbi:MAG: class I SAM-dependent RNA methyltransferase [Desulfobulbaceae bacterium]|nr:class I SAM-dependent RNA methyltransferase [Desulfobulbaceae bacterium]